MVIRELKAIVFEHLNQSDLDGVFDVLEKYKGTLNKKQQEQLTLIRVNFLDLKNRNITGLLTDKEFRVERQKVTHNILRFLNGISDSEKKEISEFFYELLPYVILSLVLGVVFAILIFILRTL